MNTITIKRVNELETVRKYWESWQRHPNSDFEHFKLFCSLGQKILSPYVAVVERTGEPCSLMVARLERTEFMPKIGYFKLFKVSAKVLKIINQGFLGEVDKEIGKVILSHLWSLISSGEVDAVAFHQLPESSPILQTLLKHGPPWWCEKRLKWSVHREMVLPEKVGFMHQKLRSKHRSWIRRKQRELEAAFPAKVSWRWMNHFDDIPGLCARLEEVAGRTYQRGLGAGFVDNEEHRRRFALFSSRGQLRVQLLGIEDEIRAFWIGTVYKNVFHSSETGYDPDLLTFEPGTLVFVRMVDELIKEGVQKIDFGLGDAFYKQRFGDHCWQETTVHLFAPTAKGLLLRSATGFSRMFDSAGRRLLERLRLLNRFKRGWRRRLAPAKPETCEK